MIIKVDKIRSYQTLVYKNGFRTFKKKEYDEYSLIIKNQLKKLNFEISENTDISVKIIFYFKIAVSLSKTKKSLLYGEYCKKKIDLDNITKPILDIISDYYNFDDKNVIKLELIKKWDEEEKIDITIKKI